MTEVEVSRLGSANYTASLKDSIEMASCAAAYLSSQDCQTAHFTNKLVGSGNGIETRILFDDLYAFLQEVGKQLNTEIYSIADLKQSLKSGRLSRQHIEAAYAKATGRSASFDTISKIVGNTVRIIELSAVENQRFYAKLNGAAEQYLNEINQLREKTKEMSIRQALDELYEHFSRVRRQIEYITQSQLKEYKVQPILDYDYMRRDDQDKAFFDVLKRLQDVLVQCYVPDHSLGVKFTTRLEKYAFNPKMHKRLIKLLYKSPLVVHSDYVFGHQIQESLLKAFEYATGIGNKSDRDKFLGRLMKTMHKLLEQKMSTRQRLMGNGSAARNDSRLDGRGLEDQPEASKTKILPPMRSAYKNLQQDEFVKDQRVAIFKYKVNYFYVQFIKCYYSIFDKNNFKQLDRISMDLYTSIQELKQVYEDLTEKSDKDINDIIKQLQKDELNSMLSYNSSLFRLRYIRDELSKRAKDIQEPFKKIIEELGTLIGDLVDYLEKSIKRGAYASHDEVLDVEGVMGLDLLTDEEFIKQRSEMNEWMDYIKTYLSILHVKQNLSRVKRELESIDEKTYYAHTTVRQLKDLYTECDKFYDKVNSYYTQEEDKVKAVFDPTLSNYLYHIALRFQSSIYISKGTSGHPYVNPRYLLFGTDTKGNQENILQNIQRFSTYFASGAPLDRNYGVRAINPAAPAILGYWDRQRQPQKEDDELGHELKCPFPLQQDTQNCIVGTEVRPVDSETLKKFLFRVPFTSYIAWKNSYKALGLLEELGEGKLKLSNTSTQDDDYSQIVPAKPVLFEQLESAIEQDQIMFQHIIQTNIARNAFISDMIPNNPALALYHLKQLLFSLHYNKLRFPAMEVRREAVKFSFIDNTSVKTAQLQLFPSKNFHANDLLKFQGADNAMPVPAIHQEFADRIDMVTILARVEEESKNSPGFQYLKSLTAQHNYYTDDVIFEIINGRYVNMFSAIDLDQNPLSILRLIYDKDQFHNFNAIQGLGVDVQETARTVLQRYLRAWFGQYQENQAHIQEFLLILHAFFNNLHPRVAGNAQARVNDFRQIIQAPAPGGFGVDVANSKYEADNQKLAMEIMEPFIKEIGSYEHSIIEANGHRNYEKRETLFDRIMAYLMLETDISQPLNTIRLNIYNRITDLVRDYLLLNFGAHLNVAYIEKLPVSQPHAAYALRDNPISHAVRIHQQGQHFRDEMLYVNPGPFGVVEQDEINPLGGPQRVQQSLQFIQTHTENIYHVIRSDQPNILQRLMQVTTRFDTDKSADPSSNGDTIILQKLVKLLAQNAFASGQLTHNPRVACFNNEILKEYLLPQIQIPFVNQALGDAFIQLDQRLTADQSMPIGKRIVGDPFAGQEYRKHVYNVVLRHQYGLSIQEPTGYGIDSGQSYTSDSVIDRQSGKRWVVDSVDVQNTTIYGTPSDNRLAIPPMFGHYLFMPITKGKQGMDTRMNGGIMDIMEAALRVKRQYNSNLNCFFDQASRTTARDYIKKVDNNYDWPAKLNSVYHALENPSLDLQFGSERQQSTYRSKRNAFFEYQLFMAQQMQYFALHGCKQIYDPVIRNQIFQVANKLYRGTPLFPFQDNKVRVNNTWDDIRIVIKSDRFNSAANGAYPAPGRDGDNFVFGDSMNDFKPPVGDDSMAQHVQAYQRGGQRALANSIIMRQHVGAAFQHMCIVALNQRGQQVNQYGGQQINNLANDGVMPRINGILELREAINAAQYINVAQVREANIFNSAIALFTLPIPMVEAVLRGDTSQAPIDQYIYFTESIQRQQPPHHVLAMGIECFAQAILNPRILAGQGDDLYISRFADQVSNGRHEQAIMIAYEAFVKRQSVAYNQFINPYSPIQPQGSCTKKMLSARSDVGIGGGPLVDQDNANAWLSDIGEAYYYQNNQYHVALTKPFGLYRPIKNQEDELTIKPRWYTTQEIRPDNAEVYRRVARIPARPNQLLDPVQYPVFALFQRMLLAFVHLHEDKRIRDLAMPYLNQSPYLKELITKKFPKQTALSVYSNDYARSIEKLLRELNYEEFYRDAVRAQITHDEQQQQNSYELLHIVQNRANPNAHKVNRWHEYIQRVFCFCASDPAAIADPPAPAGAAPLAAGAVNPRRFVQNRDCRYMVALLRILSPKVLNRDEDQRRLHGYTLFNIDIMGNPTQAGVGFFPTFAQAFHGNSIFTAGAVNNQNNAQYIRQIITHGGITPQAFLEVAVDLGDRMDEVITIWKADRLKLLGHEIANHFIGIADQVNPMPRQIKENAVYDKYLKFLPTLNSKAFEANHGLYPITDDFVQKQPRLSIGIFLKDVKNNVVKHDFIQKCRQKDETLVKNGVLRVTEGTFGKLLEILREDEQSQTNTKQRFRVYISECIRLQYHANACVLEQTEPFKARVAEDTDMKIEKFLQIAKKVVRIKKQGCQALLKLAERVELLLACDVRETLDHDLKYTDIDEMVDKLTLYNKREEVEKTDDKAFKVADECLNINQYISLYSNKLPFKSVYNQRSKLQGSGIDKLFKDRKLYSYDMNAYYRGIDEYLERIQTDITRDMNLRGFAQLFLSSCNVKNDPELSSIKPEMIESLIRDYLIASAIDIDTSLLETNFSINAIKPDLDDNSVRTIIQNITNSTPSAEDVKNYKSQLTQFEFDLEKKMRLIGIDAIYIPQNWQMSQNHGGENCHIVPHEASECTLELNFLYDNIVNAMSQKLINALGLYRMQVRRKNDLMIPRLLFGAKKKGKGKRSQSVSQSHEEPERFDPVDLVESKDNFDHKRFELYYRLYLLCMYYFDYFNRQKVAAATEQDKETILLHIKPNNNAPEGSLLKLLFTLFEESVRASRPIDRMSLNVTQLKEYVSCVDRIIDYHSLKENTVQRVYDYIVEYVNKNYGIINVQDFNNIQKIVQKRQDSLTKDDHFNVRNVLDQMSGVNVDDTKDFEGMLQFKQETVDIENNNSYLNISYVKRFIDNQIAETNVLLDSYQKNNSQQQTNLDDQTRLYRIFRSLRYELKDKNREQKLSKLLELINNPRDYREYKHLAFNIHEEVVFPLELLNQFYKIADLISFADFGASTDAVEQALHTRIRNLAEVVDPYYSHEELGMVADQVKKTINSCLLISQINTHIAHSLQNNDFIDITRILQDYNVTYADNQGVQRTQTLQIVRYDMGCRRLIQFIMNLGQYVIQSIKYKKHVTEQIDVSFQDAQGNTISRKLNDDAVVQKITDTVATLVRKLNRGKAIDAFSNRIVGGTLSNEEKLIQTKYEQAINEYFTKPVPDVKSEFKFSDGRIMIMPSTASTTNTPAPSAISPAATKISQLFVSGKLCQACHAVKVDEEHNVCKACAQRSVEKIKGSIVTLFENSITDKLIDDKLKTDKYNTDKQNANIFGDNEFTLSIDDQLYTYMFNRQKLLENIAGDYREQLMKLSNRLQDIDCKNYKTEECEEIRVEVVKSLLYFIQQTPEVIKLLNQEIKIKPIIDKKMKPNDYDEQYKEVSKQFDYITALDNQNKYKRQIKFIKDDGSLQLYQKQGIQLSVNAEIQRLIILLDKFKDQLIQIYRYSKLQHYLKVDMTKELSKKLPEKDTIELPEKDTDSIHEHEPHTSKHHTSDYIPKHHTPDTSSVYIQKPKNSGLLKKQYEQFKNNDMLSNDKDGLQIVNSRIIRDTDITDITDEYIPKDTPILHTITYADDDQIKQLYGGLLSTNIVDIRHLEYKVLTEKDHYKAYGSPLEAYQYYMKPATQNNILHQIFPKMIIKSQPEIGIDSVQFATKLPYRFALIECNLAEGKQSTQEYMYLLQKAKKYLRNGDLYQLVTDSEFKNATKWYKAQLVKNQGHDIYASDLVYVLGKEVVIKMFEKHYKGDRQAYLKTALNDSLSKKKLFEAIPIKDYKFLDAAQQAILIDFEMTYLSFQQSTSNQPNLTHQTVKDISEGVVYISPNFEIKCKKVGGQIKAHCLDDVIEDMQEKMGFNTSEQKLKVYDSYKNKESIPYEDAISMYSGTSTQVYNAVNAILLTKELIDTANASNDSNDSNYVVEHLKLILKRQQDLHTIAYQTNQIIRSGYKAFCNDSYYDKQRDDFKYKRLMDIPKLIESGQNIIQVRPIAKEDISKDLCPNHWFDVIEEALSVQSNSLYQVGKKQFAQIKDEQAILSSFQLKVSRDLTNIAQSAQLVIQVNTDNIDEVSIVLFVDGTSTIPIKTENANLKLFKSGEKDADIKAVYNGSDVKFQANVGNICMFGFNLYSNINYGPTFIKNLIETCQQACGRAKPGVLLKGDNNPVVLLYRSSEFAFETYEGLNIDESLFKIPGELDKRSLMDNHQQIHLMLSQPNKLEGVENIKEVLKETLNNGYLQVASDRFMPESLQYIGLRDKTKLDIKYYSTNEQCVKYEKIIHERKIKSDFSNKLRGRGVQEDMRMNRDLKLIRPLQDRYTLLTCYDSHPEEVYIFNKIIKELIHNTQVISAVPKSYVRLFQGIWDGSTSSSEYGVLLDFDALHNRNKEGSQMTQKIEQKYKFDSKYIMKKVFQRNQPLAVLHSVTKDGYLKIQFNEPQLEQIVDFIKSKQLSKHFSTNLTVSNMPDQYPASRFTTVDKVDQSNQSHVAALDVPGLVSIVSRNRYFIDRDDTNAIIARNTAANIAHLTESQQQSIFGLNYLDQAGLFELRVSPMIRKLDTSKQTLPQIHDPLMQVFQFMRFSVSENQAIHRIPQPAPGAGAAAGATYGNQVAGANKLLNALVFGGQPVRIHDAANPESIRNKMALFEIITEKMNTILQEEQRLVGQRHATPLVNAFASINNAAIANIPFVELIRRVNGAAAGGAAGIVNIEDVNNQTMGSIEVAANNTQLQSILEAMTMEVGNFNESEVYMNRFVLAARLINPVSRFNSKGIDRQSLLELREHYYDMKVLVESTLKSVELYRKALLLQLAGLANAGNLPVADTPIQVEYIPFLTAQQKTDILQLNDCFNKVPVFAGSVPMCHSSEKYQMLQSLIKEDSFSKVVQSDYFRYADIQDITAHPIDDFALVQLERNKNQRYLELVEKYSPQTLLMVNKSIPSRALQFVEGFGEKYAKSDQTFEQVRALIANDFVTHVIAHYIAYKTAYDEAVKNGTNVARVYNEHVFNTYDEICLQLPRVGAAPGAGAADNRPFNAHPDINVLTRDRRTEILNIIKTKLQGLPMILKGVSQQTYERVYDSIIDDFAKIVIKQRQNQQEITVAMNILQSPHTLVAKGADTYIIPIAIESKIDETMAVNRVQYNTMMRGILYDGCDDSNDAYSAQQIIQHNNKTMCVPSDLRSHFTSGVLHFASKLLRHLNSLQTERDRAQLNLDAMQLVQIQQGTETNIVSSCIYASAQLQNLTQLIDMQTDMLNTFSLQTIKDQTISDMFAVQVNSRMAYYNNLKRCVQKFQKHVDEMITVKQQAIPNYLANKILGPNNSAILSNFNFLTDLNGDKIIDSLSRQQQTAYARYIYRRQQGDVQQVHSELIKELGQEYNAQFVKEVEPFIWFLSQFKLKAHNSFLNPDGVYQELVLMQPPVDYMPSDSRARFTVAMPTQYTSAQMDNFSRLFRARIDRVANSQQLAQTGHQYRTYSNQWQGQQLQSMSQILDISDLILINSNQFRDTLIQGNAPGSGNAGYFGHELRLLYPNGRPQAVMNINNPAAMVIAKQEWDIQQQELKRLSDVAKQQYLQIQQTNAGSGQYPPQNADFFNTVVKNLCELQSRHLKIAVKLYTDTNDSFRLSKIKQQLDLVDKHKMQSFDTQDFDGDKVSKYALSRARITPGGATNIAGDNVFESIRTQTLVGILRDIDINLTAHANQQQIVDLLRLPAQKRTELQNIENCLQPQNPQIIEIIANHTIGQAQQPHRLDMQLNIIDLGIIPINLQMIKKDVGLLNIFLNSSLYKEYLSKLEFNDNHNTFADIETARGLLQGTTDINTRKQVMRMLSAESYLHKYLSRELFELNRLTQQDENTQHQKFFVMPKQNQMRYELQLRVAIALYSIVKYMKKPDEEKDSGPLSTYQPVKGQQALSGFRN